MNLARVDAAAGHHIATALTFLETLTRCPVVKWSPGQREAAMETVREARAVLQADLLTLAQTVHTQRQGGDFQPADLSPKADEAYYKCDTCPTLCEGRTFWPKP